MGSGKSAIAKELAVLLACRFVDTDEWIEERSCKTISEIFQEEGEERFRILENECLEFLMEQENMVIATGGGMACHHHNIDLMNEMAETVYLEASIDILTDRLWEGKLKRPKLNTSHSKADLNSFVSSHLNTRLVDYQKSTHTIVIEQKSIQEIAEEIKSILR